MIRGWRLGTAPRVHVKDQGKILVIVVAVSSCIEAFPTGSITLETVKSYLSLIVTRFAIP